MRNFKPLLTAAAMALGIHLVPARAEAFDTRPDSRVFDGGRLAQVRVAEPSSPPRAFIVLFSGPGGWDTEAVRAANLLAAQGAIVAGIDLPAYVNNLRSGDDEDCHYVVGDIEGISHQLQRRLGVGGYLSPIIVGLGAQASTMAYAALSQAPKATLAGAVSIGFDDRLATRLPLCPGSEAVPVDGTYAYAPAKRLQGWWVVEPAAGVDPTGFVAANSDTQVKRLRRRHSDADALAQIMQPVLQRLDAADLPLVDEPLREIPADHPGRLMAVIYSGDGGWRDLDREIGETLAKSGVPVVGVDSLRYFWSERSPDEVAQELVTILDTYGARWGTDRVVLIGYSFGADILPFVVNRLPKETRAEVVQISLLAVSTAADFEIHVSGWLGAPPSSEARPLLPEAAQLDPASIQCFYGEEDEETACKAPVFARSEIIRTEGGHHFDGDYQSLARKILDSARRRMRTLDDPS